MALNDGDKAECKEIAREIIKEVISEHIMSCPTYQKVCGIKKMLLGVGIGLGVTIGGGTGWQFIKNIIDSVSK